MNTTTITTTTLSQRPAAAVAAVAVDATAGTGPALAAAACGAGAARHLATAAAPAAPLPWRLARRAARLEPSVIREILKLSERPGVISLAGGLPAADLFPLEAMRDAAARVLGESGREALQYAASEGFGPLREWIAAELAAHGMRVAPSQVLVTTGSQQGLDLVGKLLVDAGSRVAVESPTYLGALQAFAPFEPEFTALRGDAEGPDPDTLRAARGARFAYLLPNFQNPSGRCIGALRRRELVAASLAVGVPLLEDNPYGELWLDQPPPPPLAALAPEHTIYLGSFSKLLAPGLRLGYVVAPPALYPKLLQAKQAADLHTPGFNQRLVWEIVKDGFLAEHLPRLRARYRERRDAMAAALARHFGAAETGHFGAVETEHFGGASQTGVRWSTPCGGMFFWLELPSHIDAAALLPLAFEAGVAYVPGAAFYCEQPRANTLRLSFVTVAPAQIDAGIATLARLVAAAPGLRADAAHTAHRAAAATAQRFAQES